MEGIPDCLGIAAEMKWNTDCLGTGVKKGSWLSVGQKGNETCQPDF